jgi:tRNA(Ile)-lysidine synthase
MESVLLSAVRGFLNREGLRGRVIVVAVSGGSDSLALLHALHGETQVTAAHLNHQLRGPESDADEAFVAAFCQQHAIPFHVQKLPVAVKAAEAGENLESAARRLRYDWLLQVARQVRANHVATGHTLNDQAETVLFNLLRGTGLRGLRGIAATRDLATGIKVIRPLLTVTRQDVLEYLAGHGLQAREDSSNLDLRYTRNRIRHQLLPLLREQFNPAVDQCLARLAEQAAEMLDDQQARVRALLIDAERPKAGEMVVLDASRLASISRHDLRELFCLIWEREQWPRGEIGHADWDRLAQLALGTATAWDLPGGVKGRRRGKVLQLSRTATS